MHFLAPALLLGLVAAVLPAIIHRIGRRRANPVRFAAMELLLRAEREVSARRRLRDVLLLIARTGVAVALPLAFARPFAEVRSDLPAVTGRSQSAVVVLDDSASMRRQVGGEPLFEAARARARGLIEHLSADSEVALVLASEGSTAPVAELSGDRGRVLAALTPLTASARRADFAAALRRASQFLTGSPRADRVIYVVTDLQASGWEEVTPSSLSGGPEIVVLDPSGGAPWENRAVVALSAEPAPEEGAQGVTVIAEIANFSATPAQNLGITLRLDGNEVARGFIDVPAGGRARKRFVHNVSGVGGTHQAEVVIDPDDFPLDDRRACRVEASRGLRVLIVDGDPRTVRTEDETFFLEAALRAGGSGFSVTSVLPDDAASRDLEAFGAIFLANVNQPSPALAAALQRYVESGGGVFISVGDKVDGDAWNQTAKKLLPQPLGLKRSAAAAPGQGTEGETVDLRPAERLAPIDRRHPLLAAFPAKGEGLTSARFFQFLLLAPVPDAPGRRVVLRYENGAPALVEAEVGRGRVLLLTTTVDREWTDLPIRPGFLPLVQEATRFLAGAPSGDAAADLLVGERRELALGADDRRLEIIKPSGQSQSLQPTAHAGDTRARHAVLIHGNRRAGALSCSSDPQRRHRGRARGSGLRGHHRQPRVQPGAAARRRPSRSDGRSGGRRPRASPPAGAVARARRRGDRARAAGVRVDAAISPRHR